MYARRYFGKEQKNPIKEMVTYLKESFRDIIKETKRLSSPCGVGTVLPPPPACTSVQMSLCASPAPWQWVIMGTRGTWCGTIYLYDVSSPFPQQWLDVDKDARKLYLRGNCVVLGAVLAGIFKKLLYGCAQNFAPDCHVLKERYLANWKIRKLSPFSSIKTG